jgi:mono/diheme cytochrome c family protein
VRKIVYILPACLLSLAALVACEKRRELREWQVSDHQPPPAVAPEGQGQGAEQQAGEEGGDSTARAAAALWSTRCASCHGADGRGDGAARPPGAALPDFTSAAYQQKRADGEIHGVIKLGRGMMPPFGDQLTEVGIAALVQHVRSLARPQ